MLSLACRFFKFFVLHFNMRNPQTIHILPLTLNVCLYDDDNTFWILII